MTDPQRKPTRDELDRLRQLPLFGSFAYEAVPKAFEWIRWSISLAIVDYAATAAKSAWLSYVFQIGLMLLALYYFVHFRKLLYETGGLFKKMPKMNAPLSAIVASVLALLTYLTVASLTSAVTMLQK